MITNAIRRDPGWNDGDYASQPLQWVYALPIFAVLGNSAARMRARSPTPDTAALFYDATVYNARQYDANDALYWFESSWDYDPEPALPSIRARLLAVNFADDLMNPVDVGVMQRLVPRVPGGNFVEIPETRSSYGNQAYAHPEVWKGYVSDLMQSLPPEPQ